MVHVAVEVKGRVKVEVNVNRATPARAATGSTRQITPPRHFRNHPHPPFFDTSSAFRSSVRPWRGRPARPRPSCARACFLTEAPTRFIQASSSAFIGPRSSARSASSSCAAILRACEADLHAGAAEREAIAVRRSRRRLARRRERRVDQIAPARRGVGDHARRVVAQAREDLVLGAGMRRVVAHHDRGDVRVLGELLEREPVVARDHDVAAEACLTQPDRGLHDPGRRLFVPPAEQQEVGAISRERSQCRRRARRRISPATRV